ncbi:hypothetical protein [Alteromonas oceanisediminis]|uniref:hypothetical protein n=1 Tax=Alteromonas oceanisediminis TaxID=2836180 RepID=UPI001BDAC78D|nr:hypothetical protein [Alteromonas oceanisediminis]MBT0585610.1 hypothetical protein [Alteromonas oceanisediminis]
MGTLLFLTTVYFFSVSRKIPFELLVRDTNAISQLPFYFGSLSTIGIILWAMTASVCFITATVLLTGSRSGNQSCFFFICAGLLSSLLLVDDAFMLHESVFPRFLLISNSIVLGIYALSALLFFTLFFRFMWQRSIVPLMVSGTCLALSIIFDKVHDNHLFDAVGISGHQIPFLLEDGFKLLGIVGWFGYFFMMSAIELRKVRAVANPAQPENAPPRM